MINFTGPEESTFASAHRGDRIELARCSPYTCIHPPGRCPGDWQAPLRLLTEPEPCPDPPCGARCCNGIDTDGRTVTIHAAPTRATRVLEHGPTHPTRRSA
jgi:hypothetical protein